MMTLAISPGHHDQLLLLSLCIRLASSARDHARANVSLLSLSLVHGRLLEGRATHFKIILLPPRVGLATIRVLWREGAPSGWSRVCFLRVPVGVGCKMSFSSDRVSFLLRGLRVVHRYARVKHTIDLSRSKLVCSIFVVLAVLLCGLFWIALCLNFRCFLPESEISTVTQPKAGHLSTFPGRWCGRCIGFASEEAAQRWHIFEVPNRKPTAMVDRWDKMSRPNGYDGEAQVY